MLPAIQRYLFQLSDFFVSQTEQLKMDNPELYPQQNAAFSNSDSPAAHSQSMQLTSTGSIQANVASTGQSNGGSPSSSVKVAKKSKVKAALAEPQEKLVLVPNLAVADGSNSVSLAASEEGTIQNQELAIALFQQADQQLQQGAIDAAINLYRQSLQHNPNSVEAYQHLAQALSKQGNLEEAAVCYRKAIEITTQSSVAPSGEQQGTDFNPSTSGIVKARKAGVVKARKGAAESASLTNLKVLPWYEEAAFHLQQGKVQCDLKNWDAALRECERAIELMGPKTAEAYHLMGQALQGKGQLEDAKKSYSQAITLQPEAAEVHAYLGSVYAEQRQFQEAANCYLKAIQQKPDFAGAYWELGEIYQKLGDRSRATDFWYKALQLEPNWATAKEHWQLGTALAEQNKLEQAELSYRRAIQFDPTFSEAYHNLGIILGKQRKWQAALECHHHAVQIEPNKPQVWAGLGRALSALEKWEEAIAAYHQVTKLRLDDPQGYAIFQHALAQLEQCQKALVARSYYDVAEGLSQQGKWQEAINCYRQAIERNPGSAQLHASLGKALAAIDRWKEAISAYQQAMELAPDETEYYLAFGDVLIRREQMQKQKQHGNQAVLHQDLKKQRPEESIVKENNKLQTANESMFTLL